MLEVQLNKRAQSSSQDLNDDNFSLENEERPGQKKLEEEKLERLLDEDCWQIKKKIKLEESIDVITANSH